jgi:hypothetical protein
VIASVISQDDSVLSANRRRSMLTSDTHLVLHTLSESCVQAESPFSKLAAKQQL